MSSKTLKEKPNLLRSKLQSLECDLNRAHFLLDDHCSGVKARIDFKTELMIKEINETRLDLFSQIDQYQAELVVNVENSESKV
jgi:hypothetical protein